MRILFDQGTPVPLRKFLHLHEVETVFERGWSSLTNGALLTKAEEADFAIFVTTDQKLLHQQNLSRRRIAIIVLSTTSWPRIQKVEAIISQTIESALPGSFCEVDIP